MQTIIDAWFVQGMIKATSDAWLKGWDERNGGNLTLRLDAADIAPYEADFHAEPRYIALPGLIKARSKPLDRRPAPSAPGAKVKTLGITSPPPRPAGRKVGTVDELVAALQDRGVTL